MSVTQPYLDPLLEGVVWRRAWAWVVDLLLIGVLVAVLWVVLATFGLMTMGLGLPLLGLLPVVPLAYHALFVAGTISATPGQAMLDLAVRREDDLGPPSFVQAALFTAGLWLTISVFSPLLLLVFFSLRNRALHDMAAGVVVVRRRALTTASPSATMYGGSPLA